MKQKVVLHFLDGMLIKGTTSDFSEEQTWLHLTKRKTEETIRVALSELKAIFFVKSFDGHQQHAEQMYLPSLSRKIVVAFKGGEKIGGDVTEMLPEKIGFFLYISDWRSNNEKIFVLNTGTEEICERRPLLLMPQ
jgi:hypothetical protein